MKNWLLSFVALTCTWGMPAHGAEDAAALKERAEQGDAAAQFQLAHALYWAEGMERDLEQSAQWAQKSAKAGNPKAQFLHGVQLLLAHGIEGDSGAAFDLLRTAGAGLEAMAAKGDARAQVYLAELYLRGLNGANQFKEDIPLVRKWYTAAAKQGNAEGAFMLGLLTRRVRQPGDTPEQVAQWFRQAAEADHPLATHSLAEMHLTDQLGKPDPAKAAKWLKQSAAQGLAMSQHLYGTLVGGPSLGQRDTKAAMEWFKKAAAQGFVPSQRNLAVIFHKGDGVKADPKRALFWLSVIERHGPITPAERTMMAEIRATLSADENLDVFETVRAFRPQPSRITRNGEFGLFGTSRAMLQSIRLDYLKREAESGNTEVALSLGEELLDRGVMALNQSRQLAQQNNAAASEVRKIADQLFTESRHLLGLAAKKNLPAAQNQLAWLALKGYGTEPNPAQAAEWWEKSAKQGNLDAKKNLALLYTTEKSLNNPKRAFELNRQLAETGDAPAMDRLGGMYMNGVGVEQDHAQAGKYYLQAARQGFARAQDHLGYFHFQGHGKNGVDHKEAIKWLTLAARQGVVTAQIAVGMMHHEGNGLPRKDSLRGYEWLLIAERTLFSEIREGSPARRRELAELGQTLVKYKRDVSANLNEGNLREAEAKAGKFVKVDLYRPGLAAPNDPKAIAAQARRGDAEAQYQFALSHLRGLDRPVDLIAAYQWFTLAKNAGHLQAKAELKTLSATMTILQRVEGEKRVQAFRPVKD